MLWLIESGDQLKITREEQLTLDAVRQQRAILATSQEIFFRPVPPSTLLSCQPVPARACFNDLVAH